MNILSPSTSHPMADDFFLFLSWWLQKSGSIILFFLFIISLYSSVKQSFSFSPPNLCIHTLWVHGYFSYSMCSNYIHYYSLCTKDPKFGQGESFKSGYVLLMCPHLFLSNSLLSGTKCSRVSPKLVEARRL